MVACPFMRRLSWGCLPVKTERFQIQMSVKVYREKLSPHRKLLGGKGGD